MLLRLYRDKQTAADKNKFIAYQNKLKKIIKAAEKLYYSRMFEVN